MSSLDACPCSDLDFSARVLPVLVEALGESNPNALLSSLFHFSKAFHDWEGDERRTAAIKRKREQEHVRRLGGL
jgi:hypothetical protein